MSIAHLSPSNLWEAFAAICSIPHPSKHEAQLIAFIKERAKENGVQCEQDEIGNLKLSKPASQGCEDALPVVMQSHLDMVPQKNAATEHDFVSDPINAYVDGDWVTAKGTTLGADNGIGVAAILAVMFSDSITHGPLEALLTVDEEAGMNGAFKLQEEWFTGKALLNLDTEEEGELYVGCAGGVDVNIHWPVTLEPVEQDVCSYELSITGLKGGHSGIDIHKGRGNANKLLARVLFALSNALDVGIADIQGGSLRNAIPREAFARLTINVNQKEAFQQALADVVEDIDEEYSFVESDLLISAREVTSPEHIMNAQATRGLLNAILACPNGVLRNSDCFDGVVETSSNLGILSLTDDVVSLKFMTRSLKDKARDNAVQRIRSCFELIGAEVVAEGAYPGWAPSENPALLNLMKSVYQDTFGQEAGTQIIHAGLECGLLGAKYPHWDMISFGPTITGAHSPDERVNIPSVQRFWDYLTQALKALSKLRGLSELNQAV